jgi:DNA-binding PadR family transcriptional regulator
MFIFYPDADCRMHPAMYRTMGRGGWRHGFGRFGRGGPDGLGGQGFRANRIFSSADLQLLLLMLLWEKPRHGYEIIKALEERSKGFYVPSPGVIYPALSYLEEIGYATVTTEGAKKLYSITEEGRAHLADNHESADVMMAELVRVGDRMARARQRFAEDDPAEAEGAAYSSLRAARRNLRAAIGEKLSREDLARIVEILNRAAKDIRGG